MSCSASVLGSKVSFIRLLPCRHASTVCVATCERALLAPAQPHFPWLYDQQVRATSCRAFHPKANALKPVLKPRLLACRAFTTCSAASSVQVEGIGGTLKSPKEAEPEEGTAALKRKAFTNARAAAAKQQTPVGAVTPAKQPQQVTASVICRACAHAEALVIMTFCSVHAT